MPRLPLRLSHLRVHPLPHQPAAQMLRRQAGTSSSKTEPNPKSSSTPPQAGAVPDTLADADLRGRTGGGKELDSSHSAPPRPKILNSEVPGGAGQPANMTEEQRKEVDEHNRDFDAKHDRAAPAADDRVDKKFWQGGGTR